MAKGEEADLLHAPKANVLGAMSERQFEAGGRLRTVLRRHLLQKADIAVSLVADARAPGAAYSTANANSDAMVDRSSAQPGRLRRGVRSTIKRRRGQVQA